MRGAFISTLVWLLCTVPGCLEQAEPASHFIPAGFVGEVYIIFGVADGVAPEYRDGRRIYRISEDGILRTQFPPTGWSRPSYSYISSDEAEASSIPQGPSGTIHDTAENRSSGQVEILRSIMGGRGAPVPGRPGSFSSNAPCSVKYASYFVGTRSQFLDHTSRFDISEYLDRKPVQCVAGG